MVGDTSCYLKLVTLVKAGKPLAIPPSELILGTKTEGEDDTAEIGDDAQICSCNNVKKGSIVNCIKIDGCKSIGEVKSKTKAGTGCGGCLPLVQSIFNSEMKAAGNEITNSLCSHFTYSRADLYNIIRVKQLKSLTEVMKEAGKYPDSLGCEVCKPALASIFSSLWNHHILDTPSPWVTGYQRSLSRKPSTQWHVFCYPSNSRWRNYAGQACCYRRGCSEIQFVHQNHRRTAH